MGNKGKTREQHLKDYLFEQYKSGNVDFVKQKIDRRKITGMREPKHIVDAALILFFYHWLGKWTIDGAIKSAVKTADFKIIFEKKLESLKKNPKNKRVIPNKWLERIVYREYKNENDLHTKFINQHGPLMKYLIKARKQRAKDGKNDFYPGSY